MNRKEEPMDAKKRPVRTGRGRNGSDETIEQPAREADAGYDVEGLRRTGGRKPMGSTAARVIPERLARYPADESRIPRWPPNWNAHPSRGLIALANAWP